MEQARSSVHIITNHMQATIGYLELSQFDKALASAKLAAKELRLLAKLLTGYAVAAPPGSVVKVPSDVHVEVLPAPGGVRSNIVEIIPKK